MLDISVTIGGSVFYPEQYNFASGLSMIFVFPESTKVGVAFNPTKLKCAECNTPVAEVAAGSIIIRSKHHGNRHITAMSISDLQSII
jgi:hypothetical protein